ncbi:MAG: hypothetical protein Q7J27_07905 [Syntrophales bacterium]|nr:hypothetical protein [Syntrophales bacterium]
MKKYNQEMLDIIYEISKEKNIDITNEVGPEYYSWFLEITDGTMEVIISCILRDRAEYINKKIFSKEWENDNELFDYVMEFLDMIAQGVMGLGETDGKIVILMPIGPPPDIETEQKIDKKIQGCKTIIRKILEESVGNAPTSQKKELTEKQYQDLKNGLKPIYKQLLKAKFLARLQVKGILPTNSSNNQ